MAGWVKELLLDYGLNKLSIDLRSDLSSTIDSLIAANVFKPIDIYILNDYIAGYNATEIAERYTTTTDVVEAALIRILQAIETASGYTDIAFIRAVGMRDAARASELSLFLLKHGTRFFNHDIAK